MPQIIPWQASHTFTIIPIPGLPWNFFRNVRHMEGREDDSMVWPSIIGISAGFVFGRPQVALPSNPSGGKLDYSLRKISAKEPSKDKRRRAGRRGAFGAGGSICKYGAAGSFVVWGGKAASDAGFLPGDLLVLSAAGDQVLKGREHEGI